MRWLACILGLGACTPVDGQLQRTDGKEIEYALVFMQPLCFLFCNNALATTGSRVGVSGDNASGASTQSQAVTQEGTKP